VLRHFAGSENTGAMPFAQLEQLCSNAGSLVCGAAFSRPAAFHERAAAGGEAATEAAVIARRTADGFKAALADRQHTVMTWPWDHIATRVAWKATRAGSMDEETVGRQIEEIAAEYALAHREQLERVLSIWADVVAAVVAPAPVARPSLAEMGGQMLKAFEAEQSGVGGKSVRRRQ
jgi:hypothetical protein